MSELLEFVDKRGRTIDSPEKGSFLANNLIDYKGQLEFCKGLSLYRYTVASSQDPLDSIPLFIYFYLMTGL